MIVVLVHGAGKWHITVDGKPLTTVDEVRVDGSRLDADTAVLEAARVVISTVDGKRKAEVTSAAKLLAESLADEAQYLIPALKE